MKSTILFPAFVLVTAACGGGESHSNTTSGTTAAAGGETHAQPESLSNMPMGDAAVAMESPDARASATASATAMPAPEPMAPVAVVAGTPTEIPANLHPAVRITAPRDNATITTNSVEVRLAVTDWPAPQDHRHIHLVLDNEPYRRVDNPSQPFPLTNLAEGTHVLRAFPGWGTHESVKRAGAFAMVVFHVGHRTADMHFDPHAPLLTYSRPKGDYTGADAEHILLDFYVSNIPHETLSPTGFRVRYSIDGSTTGEIAQWTPHFIDHLPDGSHTITLDLLGANGQPVAGPFNHAERQITVNRTAPAHDEHAHGSMPADGGAAPTAH